MGAQIKVHQQRVRDTIAQGTFPFFLPVGIWQKGTDEQGNLVMYSGMVLIAYFRVLQVAVGVCLLFFFLLRECWQYLRAKLRNTVDPNQDRLAVYSGKVLFPLLRVLFMAVGTCVLPFMFLREFWKGLRMRLRNTVGEKIAIPQA